MFSVLFLDWHGLRNQQKGRKEAMEVVERDALQLCSDTCGERQDWNGRDQPAPSSLPAPLYPCLPACPPVLVTPALMRLIGRREGAARLVALNLMSWYPAIATSEQTRAGSASAVTLSLSRVGLMLSDLPSRKRDPWIANRPVKDCTVVYYGATSVSMYKY